MCVLRAYGEKFDVDEFVKNSNLSPYQVFRKGERRRPRSARNFKCFDASGLKATVSEGEWDDLPGQIEDATGFLHRFHDELERLVGFPNVEDVHLDFPYECRLGHRNIAVQSDFLPPSLLREAGSIGIGIVLSQYEPISDDDESEAGES